MRIIKSKDTLTLNIPRNTFHKIIATVIMLLLTCSVDAQTESSYSSIDPIPKSPEAEAFNRVKEVPSNLYNGVMNFSIPLYTVTSGDISLPISLDYEGTAIRVEQEATWVGLNWLLNAGGVITSKVPQHTAETSSISIPCNDPIGTHGDTICRSYVRDWKRVLEEGVGFTSAYPDGGEFGIKYKFDGIQPTRGGHGANRFEGPIRMRTDHATWKYNQNDASPLVYSDLFEYNNGEAPEYHAVFLGHNVTFVWDKLKKEFFIIGNKKNYKIRGNYIGGISIIDDNGIEYEFYCTELVYPEGSQDLQINGVFDQTLYLTKIKSPTGHQISLSYQDEGTYWPTRHIQETLYDSNYPVRTPPSNTDVYWKYLDNDYIWSRSVTPYYRINKKRLRSITADNLVVYFDANNNREDLNFHTIFPEIPSESSVKRLDEIRIMRRLNGDESLLKSFKFTYSYFTKNSRGGNLLEEMRRDEASLGATPDYYTNDDFMYKRLRLEKVQEYGIDGTSLPPYQFTYYDDKGDLPGKNSASQDYWGYYNGQENSFGNNHTLLPETYGQTRDGVSRAKSSGNFPSFFLADRRSHIDYVYTGMLKGVTYPTGAIATYKYELNSFSNNHYDCIKSLKTEYSAPLSQAHYNEPTLGTSTNISATSATSLQILDTNAIGNSNPTTRNSQYFLVEHGDSVSLDITFSKSGPAAYWRNFISKPGKIYRYKQVYANGSYHDVQDGIVAIIALSPNDTINASSSISKAQLVWLEPGRYELSLTGLAELPDNKAYYQSILAIHSSNISNNTSYGSGVRIASISYHDGNQSRTTSFSYGDSRFHTTGKLNAPIVNARQKLMIYQSNTTGVQSIPPASEIRYWTISNNNLGSNPSFVTYSWVKEEKEEDKEKRGSRIIHFWNKIWGEGEMWDYMKKTNDPRNGNIVKESFYDNNRNLLSETKVDYQYVLKEIRHLSLAAEDLYIGPRSVTFTAGGGYYNDWMVAAGYGRIMDMYVYPSAQFAKVSERKTLTTIEQGDSIVTHEETIFNTDLGLPSSICKQTSVPSEYEYIEYLYPSDYQGHAWIDSLSQKNILSVPLQTFTYKQSHGNRYLTGSQLFTYNSLGQPLKVYNRRIVGNTPISNDILSTENGFSLVNYQEIQDIRYDSSSHNIRSINTNGDATRTFVWGYGNKYPIACVIGAEDSSVRTCMANIEQFEAAETPSMDAVSLQTRLNNIVGTSVTTYSYDPYIGMTKSVLPNGVVNTYSYDAFNRLIKTEKNNKTLQLFDYHYRQ